MAGESLHVVAGPAAGLELPVADTLDIGRTASGAGRLGDDDQISRVHARVSRTAQGELLIEDLGSTNGTLVNGRPIAAPALLRPGDRIQLGRSTLDVRTASQMPLGPMPRIGGFDPGARRMVRRRAVSLALLGALVIAAVVVVVVSGGGGASGSGSAGAKSFDGTVYVESNSAAPGSNSVLAFRYKNGSFRPLAVREYPTGGSGSHDLSNAGVLDAEQQLVTNSDRTLLFAVNTGSDSVAVFRIDDDGTLEPVKGSPFPSLGKAPASVGVSGDELFVANKAQDGTRDLAGTPAGYATFRIHPDGSLTPLGTPAPAPPRSSPTQTYVTPQAHLMIATEEVGPFRAFKIGSGGALAQGPNSPLPLDDRVFAPQKRRGNVWPQGLVSHPRLPLVYAGVANIKRLVVYSYDASGRLTFVHSQVNQHSVLPCWTQINRAGTRLYTGNAGSQNISVFDLSNPRAPRQIQSVKLRGAGNPWNFQIDPSGRDLFMVNMRAVSAFIPAGRGNTLHSFRIGADGRLSELASSPVPIPVPLDTNPWGLTAVPRR